MFSLLVVDDDPAVAELFARVFRPTGVELLTAGSAREALDRIARSRPDVLVLNVSLRDESGLATFQRIRQQDDTIPTVFVTAAGSSTIAIEAIKLGAFDCLVKPLSAAKARDVVEQALKIRRLMQAPAPAGGIANGDPPRADALVGYCPAMQEVYKAVGRVAPQDVNVLICGESGTGKELVARAIYQHSARAAQCFLAVNCAAIPEPLLESELFGHEKGAFTGADSRRIGKFEQCSGGTLFLDEVGDMPLAMQSKVLRVLQDHRFERVGGNNTIETDLRVIAATNRDLEPMVLGGQFRADLYYRLNGFTIKLPPLRERPEDIPLLVEHFLRCFRRELGKPVCEVASGAMELLLRHPWPGNVRELQSVLKRALLQATGPILLPEFLPDDFRTDGVAAPCKAHAAQTASPSLESVIEDRLHDGSHSLYGEAVVHAERAVLTRVLRHTRGNQSQGAKILGISRGSLRARLRRLGITIRQQVSVGAD